MESKICILLLLVAMACFALAAVCSFVSAIITGILGDKEQYYKSRGKAYKFIKAFDIISLCGLILLVLFVVVSFH